MADEQTVAAEQDSNVTSEQDSGAETETEQDSGSEGSGDYLKAELNRARKEAAQYRQRAKEVEGKAATDLDKANQRIAQLEDERRTLVQEREERFLRLTVASAARELKFVDPDDALSLIDRTDLIEDGEVNEKEVAKRLRKLAEKKPYLTSAQPRTSDSNPARATGNAGGDDPAPGYGRLVSAYSKQGG